VCSFSACECHLVITGANVESYTIVVNLSVLLTLTILTIILTNYCGKHHAEKPVLRPHRDHTPCSTHISAPYRYPRHIARRGAELSSLEKIDPRV